MKERLVTIPNKELFEVTVKVTSFGNELQNQIKIMAEYLRLHEGAGLAANQVGWKNRVIVVEFDDDEKHAIPFQAFINPEIVECSDDTNLLEEGCLSVPQIELPVERALKIKLRAQNRAGKKIRLTAKGILARILQHEVDHLGGIIFTEHVSEKYFRDFPELKNLKIVFFGSGEFAVPVLKGLILLGFNPLIITEKGKPAGREQKIKPTPVAELCQLFQKKVIEIEDFTRLKTNISHPDLIFLADFGQKIPEDILKKARIAALNLHPSLLPLYRGAAPIPQAILADEKETGVTLIEMSSKIDQGPILAQIKTEILKNDTGAILENRLAILALKLLYQTLPFIVRGELKKTKQDDTKASYAKKLQKTDGGN